MPSKTPKQAKFMRAIAHGWTPSRMNSPPSRAVAQEFVDADRKYSGGFAENRYWTGGLAAMDEITAGGKRGSLDLFKWQQGGDVDYEGNGMQRGGRTRRNGGGGGLGGLTESPYTYEEQVKRDAFLNMDIQPKGTISTMLYNIQQRNLPAPEPTIAGASGTSVTGPSGEDVTVYSGPRMTSGRRGTGRRGRGGRRNGGGGGRPPGGGGGGGGPGTRPPIVPTDPASYIGASAAPPDRESVYRDQLRAHQASIAATLGSARGGHVNYYQEGGDVSPEHPEGPNPHNPKTSPYQHKLWESEHHIDPPEPEEVVEDEVAEPGFLERWFGVAPEPANVAKTEEYLESIEQARGGRVGYQAGGRVMPPPVGGVPPWIEPVGSGPGFMEPEPEPEGYQFGGMASGMGPVMRGAGRMIPRGGMPRGGVMGGQYRGVPPQRGGIQRGAPPGGGRGFMGMMNRARQQAAAGQAPPGYSRYLNVQREAGGPSTRIPIQPGGTPQGALAQMYGRAQQQQRGAVPGGAQGLAAPWQGPGPNPMTQMGRTYGGLQQFMRQRAGGPGGGGMASPGGGMYSDPRHPFYSPPGSGGSFDMRGGYTPPTRGPLAGVDPTGGRPWGGGRGKPRPGPGMMPPEDFGGGTGPIQGGPRVPPNQRGYLQKRAMMNRPPANVGGAQAQRIGMQDQQGAQARALQRGTGRPPMSRRFGRGRAGPTR